MLTLLSFLCSTASDEVKTRKIAGKFGLVSVNEHACSLPLHFSLRLQRQEGRRRPLGILHCWLQQLFLLLVHNPRSLLLQKKTTKT